MKTATVVCTTKACRLGMPTYCSTARKFASGTQHQFDQIPREFKSYFCDFHQRFFWSQRMPIKMLMPNPFSSTKNPPLNTNPSPSIHKEYVRKCANEASSVVVRIIMESNDRTFLKPTVLHTDLAKESSTLGFKTKQNSSIGR